jgi:hypothetical protein
MDTVRNPERMTGTAEPVAIPIARRLPYLPEDPKQLVRVNGAVQVGAGVMLATRTAAAAVRARAGGLAGAHDGGGSPFWDQEDPTQRKQQRTQFLKNAGLLGGLLLAAVDTEGSPSLAWRARHAAKSSRHAVRATKREAKLAAKSAKLQARAAVS